MEGTGGVPALVQTLALPVLRHIRDRALTPALALSAPRLPAGNCVYPMKIMLCAQRGGPCSAKCARVQGRKAEANALSSNARLRGVPLAGSRPALGQSSLTQLASPSTWLRLKPRAPQGRRARVSTRGQTLAIQVLDRASHTHRAASLPCVRPGLSTSLNACHASALRCKFVPCYYPQIQNHFFPFPHLRGASSKEVTVGKTPKVPCKEISVKSPRSGSALDPLGNFLKTGLL